MKTATATGTPTRRGRGAVTRVKTILAGIQPSIRWTGLAAIIAGILFAGIQLVHPADVLSSVTTNAWTIIISLKLAMCFLFLVGFTGLYVRQAKKVGWLGLVGFLMVSLSWWITTGYVFVELFVLPVLAGSAPEFVNSYLGIVNQSPGDMNIGILPALFNIGSLLYLVGGILFGVATFRARVLPRWPASLLVAAAAVTPFAALLPHALQRYAAVPLGIALIWLGYVLFAEKRQQVL
jgi:hypothetical protein